MSDAVSFAEIDVQQVELLPERTVMSTICLTDGGSGGSGGDAQGGAGVNVLSGIGVLAEGNAVGSSATGGAGGAGGPDNSMPKP